MKLLSSVAGVIALAAMTTNTVQAASLNVSKKGIETPSIVQTIAVEGATANNVKTVVFAQGTFQKRGTKWAELNLARDVRFRFDETGRDSNSVYLKDKSRNIAIRLDMNRAKIYWGNGNRANKPIYDITAASPYGGAVDIPANSAKGRAAVGKQCVKAKFGVGYVAKVRWYEPLMVVYNPDTQIMSVRGGAKPYKEENIAVLQESCIHTDYPMFAQVSVVQGKLANEAIELAIGSVFSVATAGLGDKFGKMACDPSLTFMRDFCVEAAKKVFSGAMALTGQGVKQGVNLMPDVKQTFYLGTPGKVEVTGTVWNANATETRPYGTGKSAGQFCSSDNQCSNNTCARDSARKGNKSICCPTAREGKYAGHEYCYGLTRGKSCWSNAMCGSGTCKGNAGGLRRGKCS